MLPNFLKPYHTALSNLIRLGRKSDGGYVIDKRVISKLNLVIIEFHDLQKNLKRIKDFIIRTKLRNIHINANNYGMVDNRGIPQVIEMTLINPKKFKIKKQKTTRNYPIQGLDYKNRKRGPEIKISFKK